MFATKKKIEKAHKTLSDTRSVSPAIKLVVPGYSDSANAYPILVQPFETVLCGLGVEREIVLITDVTLHHFLLCGCKFPKKNYKMQLAMIASELLRCGEPCDWLNNRIGADALEVVSEVQCTGALGGMDNGEGDVNAIYADSMDDITRQVTLQHTFGRRMMKKLIRADQKAVARAAKTAAIADKDSGLQRFSKKTLKPEIKLSKENSARAAKDIKDEIKKAKADLKSAKKRSTPDDDLEAAAASININDLIDELEGEEPTVTPYEDEAPAAPESEGPTGPEGADPAPAGA